MSKPKMSLLDVAQKVDYEGGIWDGLSWGIKSSDIADSELAALWKKLEDFAASGVIDEIQEILDENIGDRDE